MAAPTIRRLKISRFRGITELEWLPGACTNIILGGGDVGKTTLLDAIGLLLNPTNSATLSDVDYYQRDLSGFVIEAVMTLPPETLINQQTKPAWPWEWSGTQPVVPSVHEGHQAGEPVYVLRVSGSPELELIYEIAQPNGDTAAGRVRAASPPRPVRACFRG
jgi:putative ATP-dependent endonuclease of the OLD family